jgi:hypothetical protein
MPCPNVLFSKEDELAKAFFDDGALPFGYNIQFFTPHGKSSTKRRRVKKMIKPSTSYFKQFGKFKVVFNTQNQV